MVRRGRGGRPAGTETWCPESSDSKPDDRRSLEPAAWRLGADLRPLPWMLLAGVDRQLSHGANLGHFCPKC